MDGLQKLGQTPTILTVLPHFLTSAAPYLNTAVMYLLLISALFAWRELSVGQTEAPNPTGNLGRVGNCSPGYWHVRPRWPSQQMDVLQQPARSSCHACPVSCRTGSKILQVPGDPESPRSRRRYAHFCVGGAVHQLGDPSASAVPAGPFSMRTKPTESNGMCGVARRTPPLTVKEQRHAQRIRARCDLTATTQVPHPACVSGTYRQQRRRPAA